MEARHGDWVPPDSFDEYRLLQALGRGSLGQVWLAHDTVLDRLVAVTFIAGSPAQDAARRRFLTEARAAARVQHPNLVAIYRVGEIGPRPYLVSEYVRGDSLDKLARPVAWPRLLEIAMGLAGGLAAAHRQGVLHGDLHPAHVILSESGEVKLRNFGGAMRLPQVASPPAALDREAAATVASVPGEPTIAPHASTQPFVPPLEDPRAPTVPVAMRGEPPPGGSLTSPECTPPEGPGATDPWPSSWPSGTSAGARAYLPPEAWRGEPATPRSDVYSLGAVLYELGAGAPPHPGDAPVVARATARARAAASLAVAAPGIDAGFAAIVDRCLRRDPIERFASGDAVEEALEALAAGDQTGVRVLARRPQVRRPLRLRRTFLLGAAVAVAVALAVALAWGVYVAGAQRSAAAPGRCPAGMVPVPAGTFRMGSPAGQGEPDEQPPHDVTLSAYCIDRTEVTVAAYTACVAAGGCRVAPLTVNSTSFSAAAVKRVSQWCNRQDRPDHPINCVDWDQATAYCRWSSKRLPTEAEWEYAARGRDGRVYPWGNEAPGVARLNACGGECDDVLIKRELDGVASLYDMNDGWETTAPVGRYPAGMSPFRALDLAGNVAEWTADWYGGYAARAETDPTGPRTGTSRVTRGGGWLTYNASQARAAYRIWPDPALRATDLGFRCARGN